MEADAKKIISVLKINQSIKVLWDTQHWFDTQESYVSN